jgi:hypothetical protein
MDLIVSTWLSMLLYTLLLETEETNCVLPDRLQFLMGYIHIARKHYDLARTEVYKSLEIRMKKLGNHLASASSCKPARDRPELGLFVYSNPITQVKAQSFGFSLEVTGILNSVKAGKEAI